VFGIPQKQVWLIKKCLNETYSRVQIGKHLSDRVGIKNSSKQGDVLSPLLFNFTLEYTIRRVQANQQGLKLNRTHQLLVYAGDTNILGGRVHTIRKNTETFLITSVDWINLAQDRNRWRALVNVMNLQVP
jgi:hypothetical protein